VSQQKTVPLAVIAIVWPAVTEIKPGAVPFPPSNPSMLDNERPAAKISEVPNTVAA
jgi:hypothetical protein